MTPKQFWFTFIFVNGILLFEAIRQSNKANSSGGEDALSATVGWFICVVAMVVFSAGALLFHFL